MTEAVDGDAAAARGHDGCPGSDAPSVTDTASAPDVAPVPDTASGADASSVHVQGAEYGTERGAESWGDSPGVAAFAEGVWPRAELSHRLRRHRELGRRIVLTTGCFDVLHRGHVSCLQAAAALGDLLVVGVNTDAGVTRLKGPQRPANPLADRAMVLAALRAVDYVTAFDENTPAELIEALRPDVFVKGGDYDPATLPEAHAVRRVGGVVHIVPRLPGRSTTGLLERFRPGPSTGPEPS